MPEPVRFARKYAWAALLLGLCAIGVGIAANGLLRGPSIFLVNAGVVAPAKTKSDAWILFDNRFPVRIGHKEIGPPPLLIPQPIEAWFRDEVTADGIKLYVREGGGRAPLQCEAQVFRAGGWRPVPLEIAGKDSVAKNLACARYRFGEPCRAKGIRISCSASLYGVRLANGGKEYVWVSPYARGYWDSIRRNYAWNFLFGLFFLISLAGWGKALQRLLAPDMGGTNIETPVDWGIQAGWGFCALLVLGGLLCLLHAVSIATLGLVLMAGWLFCLQEVQRGIRLQGFEYLHALRPRLWHLPILLFVGFYYAGNVDVRKYHMCDDCVAYFTFAKRILDTGTLLEPFSLRRLPTLGGHSFLQAFFLGFNDYNQFSLLDCGLSRVLLAGLVYGYLRQQGVRVKLFYYIAIACVVTYPVPRLNTMSSLSGVIPFLVLLRTLEMSTAGPVSWGRLTLLALVAAAPCTMRVNFTLNIAFLLVVFSLGWLWHNRTNLRKAAGHTAYVGLCLGLFLLPWMLVLQESSAAFLYPVMKGYSNLTYPGFDSRYFGWQRFQWVLDFLSQWHIVILLLPFSLAFFRRLRPIVLPYAIAAILATVILVASFTRSAYADLYRYAFPALFAGAVYSVLSAVFRTIRGPAGSFWPRWSSAGVALLFAGISVGFQTGGAFHEMKTVADRFNIFSPPQTDSFYPPKLHAAYWRAQAVIPPSAAAIASVEHPALFDYSRNTIYNVDVVGAVSLPPGLPFFQGAQALKQYFKAQGVRYVISMDFNRPVSDFGELYSRYVWNYWTKTNTPSYHLIRLQAPYYLDYMTNIDELAKTEPVIFSEENVRVMELQ